VKLTAVAENLWLAQYPQRFFGIEVGRNVTIIRLRDGRLAIHSTAPFTSADLLAIRELGQPGWLLDATLFHDTFAKQGCAAFARIPYLAPRGFRQMADVSTLPLDQPPAEWNGELDVLRLNGIPKVNEHVFLHRASRTLIVADLLFHFPQNSRGWTRLIVRKLMRLPRLIGVSAFLRLMIRDNEAFLRSLGQLMKWDFDRIIVGHGEVIDTGGKAVLREALRERGFLVRSAGV
jgi:hypothetical protein